MNLTQRDTDQILKHTHDEHLNANRVVLVNGLNIDSDKIANSISSSIENVMGKIEWNTHSPVQLETNYKTIEVPTIIKEYVQIDRPIVVYETKIVEIERPIIVEKIQIVEIEKQIIVKEQLIVEVKVPEIIKQYVSIPLWIKISLALFLGISILTNIILLIKK